MDQTTAESPPGCLVILIALSSEMATEARVRLGHREIDGAPDMREMPRSFAARFLVDELVEGLVAAQAAGYPIPLDVAVIGYSAAGDGSVVFAPLLSDGRPRVQLLPLADIAGFPVESRARDGDPRKWTLPSDCSGRAPAAAALAEAHRLIATWLTSRYRSRPPVILHCTGGEGLDESYCRVARSLGALATSSGPVRLLHIGFASGIEPVLAGDSREGAIPEPWASLPSISAELPAEPGGRPARRAVSLNDWSIADPWSAIFDVNPTPSTSWSNAESPPFAPNHRAFWTQKLGNEPSEWEDALAIDPTVGVAVIADGASSGIYCRQWAEMLAHRYVAERPDPRDTVAIENWIHELRCDWRAALDYPTLSWTKQRKVDETGAAATLLALEVGPLDANGARPWRAGAVGDASLFWVRDGILQATFPVVARAQLGSAPLLARSNPGYRTLVLIAEGRCRPGDLFLLATDAVAGWFFKHLENSSGPDWEAFESLDADDWHGEMDRLRKANEMVNDDCTLVVLRITGAGPDRG